MKKPDYSKVHTSLSAKSGGFTLIEIIVALAIVAISVLAISEGMQTHSTMTGELERRTVASWVASNRIAEIRYDAKVDRLRPNNKSTRVKMGGYKWRVRAEVEETDVEAVFLVTVSVLDEDARDKRPAAVMTTAVVDKS